MNMTSNDLLCGDVENYFQCYSLHVFILRIALNRPCTKQLVNLVHSVIIYREISDLGLDVLSEPSV